MAHLGIAVVGREAGTNDFMTRMAGAPKESAEDVSKWDFTTRVDGQEFGLTINSPHWGAREGRRVRAARLYKNDIWFVLFDITKDADHLQGALGSAKRMQSIAVHKDHMVIYLVGNKADLAAERKFVRADLEKIAAENGMKYAEVSSANGGGMPELLQSAIKALGERPKKPSLDELLNPEGTKA